SPAFFPPTPGESARNKTLDFLLPSLQARPSPWFNSFLIAWRGGKTHAQQTATSEFTFTHGLARGNARAGHHLCARADTRLYPTSAGADLQSALHLHRRTGRRGPCRWLDDGQSRKLLRHGPTGR